MRTMRDARRPRGGGGWVHLGKARVVPRCPGVSPGRSRGGRHLGPRAGRARGAARGAPVTPGRRQAALSEVRPKKKRKRNVRFKEFWSFLANFCLLCGWFYRFWFGFSKKKSRGAPTSGCPWGRAARGASPPRATGRVAVPGVIPTSGTTPAAGAPEVHPTPPRPLITLDCI